MGATTATQQETNRRIAKVERALDHARDLHDRVKGQLAVAEKANRTLRVLELRAELAQAREALDKAAHDFEAECGIPAPLSSGLQPTPGSMDARRAADPELRAVQDQIGHCEQQINLFTPQLAQVDKAIKAHDAIYVPAASSENSAAEATLDAVYPERREIRADNVAKVQGHLQNGAQLRAKRAELRQKLENVRAKHAQLMAKRDELLAAAQHRQAER